MAMPTYLLHTLDGKPAYFDGEQIVYADQLPYWEDEFQTCLLRRSLMDIKFDEERSARFRARRGWKIPTYGYVVVATSTEWIPRSRIRDLASNLMARLEKAARRGRIAAVTTHKTR